LNKNDLHCVLFLLFASIFFTDENYRSFENYSAVLAFVMVLPLESHALKWASLSPSPPRWSLLVDADEILFLRKKLGQVCLVLEDRTAQRHFLKGAGIRCNVSYQIDDKRFIHYQQEWMHSSSFKINPQN
jgi:hypothetical protein